MVPADTLFGGRQMRVVRPVYEEADGRQFVIDDAGERVCGTWILPDGTVVAEGERPVSNRRLVAP
jgi:hypothetical protein